MKLLHLSDLHLGIRVNGFSLLEDQRDILRQILDITDRTQPQAVLIAGDVYDKAMPPAEAVSLFDEFLAQLAARGVQVFVISGNHDSPERIAFGGRLMAGSGVHMSPVYDGQGEPVELTDEFGPVRLYLLPFIKPVQVRRFFPNREIVSYTDALDAAVSVMAPDAGVRNVLLTHQFVTGASRSGSEEVTVGGADNVDARVFDCFDYVALGHLHSPQMVSRPTLRYCGTPLKYSISEASQSKSVTLVELREKGAVDVSVLPLTPLRDLLELRGPYAQLVERGFYGGTPYPDSYLHIILTDQQDVSDAAARLRTIYPWLMKLDYDNQRTRAGAVPESGPAPEQQSPLALFEALYLAQNGQAMSPEQRRYAAGLIETLWEGEA